MIELSERFWSKIDKAPNGCWLWRGTLDRDGYGLFASVHSVADSKITRFAHRLSYMAAKGDIPKGLQIDHLCRVHNCVNPDHLEAVTLTENLRRGEGSTGQNYRKTHCKRGHEFTPENTYIQWVEGSEGMRRKRACLICRREGMARWWKERKTA